MKQVIDNHMARLLQEGRFEDPNLLLAMEYEDKLTLLVSN